jgi:outer membrane lipase/esterase
VHPTSVAHRVVADLVKSLIEGPTQYGMLAEGAIQARESHIRALSDGMAMARQQPVGKFGVFGGASGGTYDVSFAPASSALDSKSSAGTIGITMRATPTVMIGAAYGSSENRGTFSQNLGTYEVDEEVFSVFASMRHGGFYGAAVGSISDVDFSDIQRNITLGPRISSTTASTEGSNASFHFTAGYDFTFGRFSVGPLVAFTAQNVTVNGFDEAGGGTAGLRMHEQTRKSEVWSLGARASMTFGNWTPWVKVTADEERRDDARLVSATPLTLLSVGSTYDIPAYRPDSKYMTWSAGISGTIVPNVGVSLGYYQVDSRGGVDQDGWHGLISVNF